MIHDGQFVKTVFGLKLKQQRQKRNLSLQDLAYLSGMSKSYLNEIENGKKFPKHEKILHLCDKLNCRYDDLVSTKLDKGLAPFTEILQSEFFNEIPLDLFGISKSNLISIISDAPKKVTAFINTLIEISKNYNLGKERFYFAALRSFQELYDNYFPEIEDKAERYLAELDTAQIPAAADFEQVLKEKFNYKIRTVNFAEYGASGKLRSIFVPDGNLLLLNEILDENQRTFILAKELGFKVLGLKPRPNTYSWLDDTSFESLLNNFYASYFAGALLINRNNLTKEIDNFFGNEEWEPAAFANLITQFTNSPETFYQRLTNLLPASLGIKDVFYLCLTKKKHSDKIEILKELHLSQQQAPYANATNEHYCRRWIAVKNLMNLQEDETLTAAQISHYVHSGLSYLVLSTSQRNPFSDGTNRSYCLGILLNSNSVKKMKFAKGISVPVINVGVTCESCGILNCEVRQAPPVRLEKEQFDKEMKNSIARIKKDQIPNKL